MMFVGSPVLILDSVSNIMNLGVSEMALLTLVNALWMLCQESTVTHVYSQTFQ